MAVPNTITNGTPNDADEVMENFNYTDGRQTELFTGWLSGVGAFTYSAAQEITVTSAMASLLYKGAKLKMTNNSSTLYFYVVEVSGTTITLSGETDLANSAITSPFYSYFDCPQGFKKGEDWYKFAANNNAQTIVPAVTFTKINLQVESYDTNNNFDNVTNYVYTVPISGLYNFSGSVEITNMVAGKDVIGVITVNSSSHYYGNRTDSGGTVTSSLSRDFKLDKGETVGLSVYQGDTVTRGTATTSTSTWFTGHFIGV